MPALPIKEIMQLRYHLDIPGFLSTAVRYNLNKKQVLIYLEIIVSGTRETIEEIGHFFSIAKHEDLTRNEILAWLDLSYGGTIDPEYLSQRLAISFECAEKVLAGLEAKGIIEDDHVL